MQFGDDLSLLSATRSGSSAASERVVRRYQAELLRAGYLLTGTSGRAAALARDTFLRFFEELMRGDEGADAREQLLGTMARLYVANPSRGELSLSQQPFIPTGASTRYAVDDQRKRVMSALERLEVQERAALVLREFSAFDEEATSRVFNRPPHVLRAMLHPARVRVREAAGASESQSVRELLTNAASDAILAELWPELEEPLERLLAQEEVKRKRMVTGAGIVVGLVVLAVAIWLTGFSPFGDDDGSQAGAAAATAMANDLVVATSPPEPTLPPTPTADLSALQAPIGDVPGRLLVTSEVRNESGPNQRRQAFYDPATGHIQPIDIPGANSNAAVSHVSANGQWLIDFQYPQDGSNSGWPIGMSAIDSETGEVIWDQETPELHATGFVGDHLYAIAAGDPGEPDALVGINLASGDMDVERTGFLEGTDFTIDSSTPFYAESASGQIIGAPDGSRLYLLMRNTGSGRSPLSEFIASYTLPNLDLEASVIRTNTSPERSFDDGFSFFGAAVTPDGRALYIPGDERVQFLKMDSPDPVTVEFPFSRLPPDGRFDIQWATSNDGRYLYAISLIRKQAAIVDLLSQSVSRAFPIDQGGFTLVPQLDDVALAGRASFNSALMNWRMVVSPDGRQLLVTGAWEDPAQPTEADQSPIWVIDMETWRVIGKWAVPGNVEHLHFVSGSAQLAISSVIAPLISTSPERTWFITLFDLGTGEQVHQAELDVGLLPEVGAGVLWTNSIERMYRQNYGRAPAIDGVQPETIETTSTLPRFNLTPAVTSVPNGGNVQLMLQVLDPTSGGPLETAAGDVRFDPASNPVLVLRQQDGDGELILVPSRTSPAEYSAATPLEGEGFWDVEIQFTTTDGQGASVTFPSLFEVVPSVPSMEGPRYSLRIETPNEPVVRQEVLVRASFVDIETGSVLPEENELRGGLPDELTATFYHAEHGFFSDSLTETRHGVYEGPVEFRGAGAWLVEVSFWSEELDRSVKISGGTVDVVPAGP